MTQGEFDYGPRARALACSEDARSIMREIVAVVGLAALAHECRIKNESLISDALGGRDRKYVRDEWVRIAAEMAPPELGMRLIRAWLGDRYEVKAKVPLTAEEKLERLQDRLASLGEVGRKLMDEALR